jgi:hypothetical protein
MKRVQDAVKRLEAETGHYHYVTTGASYCYLALGDDDSECLSLRDCTAEIEVVAAIDKYRESLKPKPRPIPEIAKDLVEYVGDGISLPHIRKLVGELKQSVDAYYPF